MAKLFMQLYFLICSWSLFALESAKILEVDQKGRTIQISHGAFDNIHEGDIRTFFTAPDPFEKRSYVLAEGEAIKVFSNYSYWDLKTVAAAAQIIPGKKVFYAGVGQVDISKGSVLDFAPNEKTMETSTIPIQNKTTSIDFGNVQNFEIYLQGVMNLADHTSLEDELGSVRNYLGAEIGAEYPLGNLTSILNRFTASLSLRRSENVYGINDLNFNMKENNVRFGVNWFPFFTSAKIALFTPFLGLGIRRGTGELSHRILERNYEYNQATNLAAVAGVKWRFKSKGRIIMAIRAQIELEEINYNIATDVTQTLLPEVPSFISYTDYKSSLGLSFFF
jgi:hypothetical protein